MFIYTDHVGIMNNIMMQKNIQKLGCSVFPLPWGCPCVQICLCVTGACPLRAFSMVLIWPLGVVFSLFVCLFVLYAVFFPGEIEKNGCLKQVFLRTPLMQALYGEFNMLFFSL